MFELLYHYLIHIWSWESVVEDKDEIGIISLFKFFNNSNASGFIVTVDVKECFDERVRSDPMGVDDDDLGVFDVHLVLIKKEGYY